MPLDAYTSYAEVRAVLGVSDQELPDDVLSLELYALGLEASLTGISETLPTDFLAVSAKDSVARTIAEQRLYRAVRLFAPYAVVVSAINSGLPLLAVKSVTDGKAGFVRDSSSPYKETLAHATANYSKYRSLVVDAVSLLGGGTTTDLQFNHMAVISPASDPVVGS